jgi:hypothetical protein
MDEPLLPYVQIRHFLPRAEVDDLLEYVLSHSDKFKAATVGNGNRSILNTDVRVALALGKLGHLEEVLEKRFRDALPFIIERAGIPPPPPDRLEIGLAAHGDGAFYRPHIDLVIGNDPAKPTAESRRVLSAVFYFHAEPKGFSGGELRLFRLGSDSGYVDIEPEQNSLVAFHSWMRHEVRPVAVPSRAFRDYRFAINCWYARGG